MNDLSPGSPPPLLRMIGSYGDMKHSGIDYNWMWENRDTDVLKRKVIKAFFSPTLKRRVTYRMSKRDKLKLFKTRRVLRRAMNARYKRII